MDEQFKQNAICGPGGGVLSQYRELVFDVRDCAGGCLIFERFAVLEIPSLHPSAARARTDDPNPRCRYFRYLFDPSMAYIAAPRGRGQISWQHRPWAYGSWSCGRSRVRRLHNSVRAASFSREGRIPVAKAGICEHLLSTVAVAWLVSLVFPTHDERAAKCINSRLVVRVQRVGATL